MGFELKPWHGQEWGQKRPTFDPADRNAQKEAQAEYEALKKKNKEYTDGVQARMLGVVGRKPGPLVEPIPALKTEASTRVLHGMLYSAGFRPVPVEEEKKEAPGSDELPAVYKDMSFEELRDRLEKVSEEAERLEWEDDWNDD